MLKQIFNKLNTFYYQKTGKEIQLKICYMFSILQLLDRISIETKAELPENYLEIMEFDEFLDYLGACLNKLAGERMNFLDKPRDIKYTLINNLLNKLIEYEPEGFKEMKSNLLNVISDFSFDKQADIFSKIYELKVTKKDNNNYIISHKYKTDYRLTFLAEWDYSLFFSFLKDNYTNLKEKLYTFSPVNDQLDYAIIDKISKLYEANSGRCCLRHTQFEKKIAFKEVSEEKIGLEVNNEISEKNQKITFKTKHFNMEIFLFPSQYRYKSLFKFLKDNFVENLCIKELLCSCITDHLNFFNSISSIIIDKIYEILQQTEDDNTELPEYIYTFKTIGDHVINKTKTIYTQKDDISEVTYEIIETKEQKLKAFRSMFSSEEQFREYISKI